MSIKLNINNSSNKSTIVAANKFLERPFSHDKRQNNGWYEYRTSTKSFSYSSLILQKNKQTKKKKLQKIIRMHFGSRRTYRVSPRTNSTVCRYHKNFILEVCYSTLSFEWSAGVWPFSVGNWYNELLLVCIQLPTIRNPR